MAVQQCRLREIVLRDKPAEMLEISPKGTVPVLDLGSGGVIDESLQIMRWALGQNDPSGLLPQNHGDGELSQQLIARNDGEFKFHLDRYKYASRYEGVRRDEQRDAALQSLFQLEKRLGEHRFLAGEKIGLCDVAIFPFVRQFANTDRQWFDALDLPHLQHWLQGHLESDLFAAIMNKYPTWKSTGQEFSFVGEG